MSYFLVSSLIRSRVVSCKSLGRPLWAWPETFLQTRKDPIPLGPFIRDQAPPSIVHTPSGSFLLLLHFGASLAMLAWFEVRDLESLFGSWKSQREDFPTGLWGRGKGGHTVQDREGWPRALLLPLLHVWTTHTLRDYGGSLLSSLWPKGETSLEPAAFRNNGAR